MAASYRRLCQLARAASLKRRRGEALTAQETFSCGLERSILYLQACAFLILLCLVGVFVTIIDGSIVTKAGPE